MVTCKMTKGKLSKSLNITMKRRKTRNKTLSEPVFPAWCNYAKTSNLWHDLRFKFEEVSVQLKEHFDRVMNEKKKKNLKLI